jgi:uncharacterized membrane protein YgcG
VAALRDQDPSSFKGVTTRREAQERAKEVLATRRARQANRQAELGRIRHPNQPGGIEGFLGELIPDSPAEIALLVGTGAAGNLLRTGGAGVRGALAGTKAGRAARNTRAGRVLRRAMAKADARAAAKAAKEAKLRRAARGARPVKGSGNAGRAKLAAAKRNATRGQRLAARVQSGRASRRGIGRTITGQGARGARGADPLSGYLAASTAAGTVGAPVVGALQAPVQAGQAFATDAKVRAETKRALKALPREFVQGLAMPITHGPADTVKMMLDAYKHQYGPLLEGDTAEFRKRLREPGSGGALGPILDTTLIAGPVASTAAGGLARAGALGPRLERIAASDRPDLRFAPGERGVKRQRGTRRLGKRLIQHRRDESRRRVQEKRYEAALAADSPDDAQADILSAENPRDLRRRNEVVPRGGVTIPGTDRVIRTPTNTTRRLRARTTAQLKGRARLALLQGRGEVAQRYRAVIGDLTDEQKRALIPVLEGTISANNPAKAFRDIRARIEQIKDVRAERAAAGKPVKIAKGRLATNDELRAWNTLLEDAGQGAEKIYTPEFARAAQELADIEHDLAARRQELGDLGTPDEDVPAAAAPDEPGTLYHGTFRDDIRSEGPVHLGTRKAASDRLDTLRRKGEGEGEGRIIPARLADDARVFEAKSDADIDAFNYLDSGYIPPSYGDGQVAAVKARAAEIRQDYDAIRYKPHAEDPGSDAVMIFDASKHLSRPAGWRAQRLPQAELRRLKVPVESMIRQGLLPEPDLGVEGGAVRGKPFDEWAKSPAFGSYINQHQDAIRAVLAEEGRLERPGYVPSERRFRDKFSHAAVGGGRGLEAEKRYGGELFRTGRRDISPRVFLQGLEKSLKREGNIKLVAEVAARQGVTMNRLLSNTVVERFLRSDKLDEKQKAQYRDLQPVAAFQQMRKDGIIDDADIPAPLLRSLKEGEAKAKATIGFQQYRDGYKAREVFDALDDLGIADDRVVLFNPKRMYGSLRRSDVDEDVPGQGEIDDSLAMRGAIDGATLRRADLEAHARGMAEEEGWIAMPQEAYQELFQAPGRLEKLLRGLDISKGAASRALLGYFNTSWMLFQIGSNAVLTGLAGVGPLEFIRAQRWWRGLDEADRKALGPVLNIQSNLMDFDKRSLGSMGGTFTRRVRAFRSTPGYQRFRRFTPAGWADMAFAIDKAQTGAFRRAVFYNQAKRDAWQRMGATAGTAARLQEKIVPGIWGKRGGAEAEIQGIIRNYKDVELHAEATDQMLGDYLTYTAGERATMQRAVMFYGFMRHSLQLALWTMPTRHPVTLGILAKLALLSDKERREMLGIDNIPFSLAGLEIDGTPDGKGLAINVARMSPLGNTLFEAEHPAALLGVLPPALILPISHLTGIKPYSGLPYRTEGKSSTDELLAKGGLIPGEGKSMGLMEQLRTFVNELESFAAPIRMYREYKFRGAQGDDTSVVFGLFGDGARPTEPPKTQPYRGRALRSQRRAESLSALDIFGRRTLGLKEITQEQIDYAREKEEAAAGKVPSSSSSGGGGGSSSSGGWRSGGSSSSSSGGWR